MLTCQQIFKKISKLIIYLTVNYFHNFPVNFYFILRAHLIEFIFTNTHSLSQVCHATYNVVRLYFLTHWFGTWPRHEYGNNMGLLGTGTLKWIIYFCIPSWVSFLYMRKSLIIGHICKRLQKEETSRADFKLVHPI